MKIKFLIVIFGFFAFNVFSQTSGRYSNEFLNIGVDARALAMGSAVVSNVSDATAGYWNPAGLSNIKNQDISLMHAAYFANIAQFDYMGYVRPINEKTAVSVSLIRFGVDNIMNTTQLIDGQGNINYDRITYFSTADYALNFSLGRKNLWKNIDVGINAKLIYRHIGKFAQGFGFGFDIGAQYQLKRWKFGLMARDITTTFNYWSIDKKAFADIQATIPNQNQDLPNNIELTLPKLQLGVSGNFSLKEHLNLLTEVNLNMRFFKMNTLVSSDYISLDPALGLEFNYYDIAFLRLGVNNFQEQQYFDDKQITFQPNAGLGFKYKGVRLDYALTNIGSDGFFSHVFSLGLDLDRFIKKKEK